MKVLFLDIDGVLLNGPDLYKYGNRYLPEEKINLLNSICEATECVIVVSSTWRLHDECMDELIAAGVSAEFHEDWKTDYPAPHPQHSLIEVGKTRGREIKEWLDRHPEVENYVIIDDNSDILDEQMDNFVKTEFEIGLTEDHAEAAKEILS